MQVPKFTLVLKKEKNKGHKPKDNLVEEKMDKCSIQKESKKKVCVRCKGVV